MKQIHFEVFSALDSWIGDNIDNITCQDIHDEYFDFTKALKCLRSTSSGFTGYSEFLIFRLLYHFLENQGEKFNPFKTGTAGTDPIVFKSANYEIANGATIHLNGKTRKPDIYVKDLRKNEYALIVEIKIILNSPAAAENIIRQWNEYNTILPNTKLLLIIYHPSNSYYPHKDKLVGVDHILLKDNHNVFMNMLMSIL